MTDALLKQWDDRTSSAFSYCEVGFWAEDHFPSFALCDEVEEVASEFKTCR